MSAPWTQPVSWNSNNTGFVDPVTGKNISDWVRYQDLTLAVDGPGFNFALPPANATRVKIAFAIKNGAAASAPALVFNGDLTAANYKTFGMHMTATAPYGQFDYTTIFAGIVCSSTWSGGEAGQGEVEFDLTSIARSGSPSPNLTVRGNTMTSTPDGHVIMGYWASGAALTSIQLLSMLVTTQQTFLAGSTATLFYRT